MRRRGDLRFSRVFKHGDAVGGRIGDSSSSLRLTQWTPIWGLQGLIIQASNKDHRQDLGKNKKIHIPGKDAESYQKCRKESWYSEINPIKGRTP